MLLPLLQLHKATHKQAVSTQMMSAPTGVIFKRFVYITCPCASLDCSFFPLPLLLNHSRNVFFPLSVKTNICRFVLNKNKAIHLPWPAVVSCKLRKAGSGKVYSSRRSPQWERHLSVEDGSQFSRTHPSLGPRGWLCLCFGTQ